MIRKVKAFGLTAVAALAMSAMVASAAQATEPGEVTAGEYPATITGVQTNTNVLSNGIRSVTCAGASLTGTLTEADDTVTITPGYTGCTANGNTTATVNTNGCTYTLTVTTQLNASTGEGVIDVDCPGTTITVDIWGTGVSHSETKLCRLEVPAQTGITGASYHNVTAPNGKKGIELTVNSANVTVHRTYGTAVNCGAATKANGTYVGNVLGTATDSLGNPIDLFVD